LPSPAIHRPPSKSEASSHDHVRPGRRGSDERLPLIETAKLNGINPHNWRTDTLAKLANRWPASRIDDLMPWAYAKKLDDAVNV